MLPSVPDFEGEIAAGWDFRVFCRRRARTGAAAPWVYAVVSATTSVTSDSDRSSLVHNGQLLPSAEAPRAREEKADAKAEAKAEGEGKEKGGIDKDIIAEYVQSF